MKLADLTTTQLERLYDKAYRRMSAGDGYQPFGYDWVTLRITKPGWYRVLRDIQAALAAKQNPTTSLAAAA